MTEAPNNTPLSSTESTELAERIADLAAAGLPLPDGLRAAASDVASRRLAGVLRMIAGELESGASIDNALSKLDKRLPAYVQGVVRAGVRSGELPALLTQMAQADRQRRRMLREVRLALVYPMVLVLLMAALVMFVVFFVLPGMEKVYTDFDTQMPALTSALLALGRGVRDLASSAFLLLLIGIPVILLFAVLLLKLLEWLGWSFAGTGSLRPIVRAGASAADFSLPLRAWPMRLLTTFPLLGPLFQWSQVASWARFTAVLLDARVPLPEALVLSAAGSRSANMANLAARLAAGVRGGASLSQQIRRTLWLPMSLVPITEWGEKSGRLPDALRTLAEMFEGRVQLRTGLIRQVVPPVFIILIASFILVLLVAIFMPLVSLIQNLA